MNNRNTGIRGLFTGPVFLTAIIAYTVATVFGIMAAFSVRNSLLGSLASLTGYSSYLNALSYGSSLGSVINMLPAIYLTVAFWLIYSAAAGYNTNPGAMSITGLKMIDIYLLIANILVYVAMGFSVLGAMASMIGADSMLGYFGVRSGNVVMLILLGLLVLLGVLAFSAFIIIRARQNCQSIMQAIVTGRVANDISAFIPVICFIMGGLYGLDALRALAFGSISVISDGANATAAICFGLFLNQYRAIAFGSGYSPAPQQDFYTPAPVHTPVRALLYVQRNSDNVEINTQNFVIGRSAGRCNYVIPNPGVSSVHATITNRGGKFYIRDENSTNHVYLNGQRIAPGTWIRLHNRTEIRLYNELLMFLHE